MRESRFYIKVIFLLFFGLFVATCRADGLKIGFVSTDRVFKESWPAVQSQKRLQQEFSEREKEIASTSDSIRELQQKIEKDQLTMSKTALQETQSELARLSRDVQRLQREFREELNLRKNEEMKLILEIANKAIFKIAEEEKFDLILQEAVYRSPRLDITEKVIEALKPR